MSLVIHLDDYSRNEALMISKDLTIVSSPSRSAFQGSKILKLFECRNSNVKVPLFYAMSKLNITDGNKKKSFPERQFKFTGTLRENQVPAKTQALKHLVNHNTTTLSLFPSFGKCMAAGSKVVMFDASIKNIEDIRIGDSVCSPIKSCSPNKVALICRGRSMLYEVRADLTGDTLIVNEDHILSLLDPDGNVIDMTLKTYMLKLSLRSHKSLESLKSLRSLKLFWSHVTPLKVKSSDLIEFILTSKRKGRWNTLPFEDRWEKICLSKGYPRYIKDGKLFYTTLTRSSTFTVRSTNKVGDFYGFILEDSPHRFILSSGIVTHNTVLSASISSHVRGITLVTFTRITLGAQWFKTFEDMTTARVWLVGEMEEPKEVEEFDVILCLDKRLKKLKLPLKEQIKFLIMDEAHLFCTATQVTNILSFQPKLVMACTATLDSRSDGMQEMVYKICGRHCVEPRNNDRIIFEVIVAKTNVEVELEYNKSGNVDWSSCQKRISETATRNKLILDIVQEHSAKVMILTRLVSHCKQLNKLLSENGVACSMFCGNMKSYVNKRVLIGTINKIGTGFDEASFCSDYDGVASSVMILASSIKSHLSLEQCIGRVFRSASPTIYDLVDADRISKSHFSSRKKFYKNSSAKIETR